MLKLIVSFALLLVFAAACGDPPTPTATPPAVSTPANDTEAVRQLIDTECNAVVHQEIDVLQTLWASDGSVVDANHTPENGQDDVVWKKWDSIRDRYVNTVFPSNPTFCEHPNVDVSFALPVATVVSDVKIGTTNCKRCNEWKFAKGQNGWKITQLTYNLNVQ